MDAFVGGLDDWTPTTKYPTTLCRYRLEVCRRDVGEPGIKVTPLSMFTLPNPRARYAIQWMDPAANFEWGDASTNSLEVTEFNLSRDHWYNISLYSIPPPDAASTSLRQGSENDGDLPSDFRMTRLYNEVQDGEFKVRGLCTASGRSLVYHYPGIRTGDWRNVKTWIADYLPSV